MNQTTKGGCFCCGFLDLLVVSYCMSFVVILICMCYMFYFTCKTEIYDQGMKEI